MGRYQGRQANKQHGKNDT